MQGCLHIWSAWCGIHRETFYGINRVMCSCFLDNHTSERRTFFFFFSCKSAVNYYRNNEMTCTHYMSGHTFHDRKYADIVFIWHVSEYVCQFSIRVCKYVLRAQAYCVCFYPMPANICCCVCLCACAPAGLSPYSICVFVHMSVGG